MTLPTIGEALTAARGRIAAALGLERDVASLEAHVLLGHALGQPRAWLIAHRPDPIAAADLAHFEEWVRRRTLGEPIAYLTGEREFFGLRFLVTPDVLIPRPDTELLVESALALIPEHGEMSILDLGTGSGAIALSIARHRPASRVTAVDVSPPALAVAHHNAEALACRNVQLLESDWFAALAPGQRFDLIVANPPYIAENDAHLRQGDVRFEPRLALASGPAGMDAIQRITSLSIKFLADSGHLLMEHGFEQGAAVRAAMQLAGFRDTVSHRDLAGHERCTQGRFF